MFKSQSIPETNELAPNTVLDRSGYHISHNASSAAYGCQTTALVLKNTVFLVLNGDHREALCDASSAGGLQACFDYFLEHLESANHMSEHHFILQGNNVFSTTSNAEDFLGPENIARLHEVSGTLADSPQDGPDF